MKNIFRIIKNLFSKQKMLNSGEYKEDKELRVEKDFVALLKKNTNDYNNKNIIIEEIRKKPQIIDTLSYERLVQLNNLYQERIQELKIKILAEVKNK